MKEGEKITALIALLNLIVVTVALLYYYRQAKAAQKQATLLNTSLERTTYIDFEASLFELSKLIIQHPQVRPFLYDNKPCPKPTEHDYNLVLSFCVFYLDFFDHVLTTESLCPGGTKWPKEKWDTWIKDMFKTSPSLRQILSDERHWYNENLYHLLEEVESSLNIRRSSPC